MANVSVTTHCNRACPHCFAFPGLRNGGERTACMDRPTYDRVLTFLRRSGIRQVRLLGGEPTLHPDFVWMVNRAIEAGFEVMVFSNGTMPPAALDRLASLPPEKASVLLNMNAFDERDDSQTLSRLAARAIAGFTLCSPNPRLDRLLELVQRFSLSRNVRLGLAHRVVGGANTHLGPSMYDRVGRTVVAFARAAAEKDIRISLDCGFTPCMFPEHELSELGAAAEDVGVRCNPIPDILPDGNVIACYPLAALGSESLPDQEDANDLRERFTRRLDRLRTLGVFPECSGCRLRASGRCTGGCLATAIGRCRNTEFTFDAPAPKSPEARPRIVVLDQTRPCEETVAMGSRGRRALWSIPYVDQPVAFWETIATHFGSDIESVYFPAPDGLLPTGRPVQSSDHLETFLKHEALPGAVVLNPVVLPRPADEIAPGVVESLRRLHGDYGVRCATVSSVLLAQRIGDQLPDFRLTASTLLDIATPAQALAVNGLFDRLVVPSKMMRNLPALGLLRSAFEGEVQLIVNEGCLPGCVHRLQHFFEMAASESFPASLCEDLLRRKPWLRLTGAWVLPQHLDLYSGLYDGLKLSGRVTLQDAGDYHRVLGAYVGREPLTPDRIGGGPASVQAPLEIDRDFFASTLTCGQTCHECGLYAAYYDHAMNRDETAKHE